MKLIQDTVTNSMQGMYTWNIKHNLIIIERINNNLIINHHLIIDHQSSYNQSYSAQLFVQYKFIRKAENVEKIILDKQVAHAFVATELQTHRLHNFLPSIK